ncbi:glucose dehydrogenase [Pseudoxanthomonas broegbernensis]|uniref:Glucose dehydrogenase n=1 Tax=Pseudoxanthomonas broegbernensis TaxID=83619 RepID=A0A7V8GLJ4_9GAMM|nr:PQQ-dependent sugar dehydrogenase [Pseudoxanthomonas broegbernensis]KAF1685901.1 glucose dehydrogenase [Pseudoxanthomonas broegbernensis]MBB6064128.1 glucose/arabinose dehydrogenase [Pseudoxanthomonas broegbernensis]
MIQFGYPLVLGAVVGLLSACGNTTDTGTQAVAPVAEDPTATPGAAFAVAEVTKFDSPWAMTFLPDGRLLVTEMAGTLRLFDPASRRTGTVSGVPEVVHVAQGGLGDVVLHPQYASNRLVYLSYVEPGDGGLGAVVARARLALDENGGGALQDLEAIWRQTPKKSGDGHFGYRIAFDADGKLWIGSSERKEFDPAQDMDTNLGKIVRLNDDGSVPADNPFADRADVGAQVWTLGHRNILGLAFDAQGRLWAHEMGPMGGDELNRIEKGANYGYPIVSNGDHYDGTPIPSHDTRPEFRAPVITWTPVISPAGFIVYDGDLFADWKGDGFIGGLSSMSLVRIEFEGENAREAQRFDMQRRIREVEQGPDGALWLLEDGTREGEGWLLKLTPRDA